ncbi:glutamate ABC transporter substrate-binding protein [Pseudonocardiaceae bacterium YIM PH 21723]|nr:glutamate ABC transporter substrate-binding protein [Pseudonocardiaceae bacterium YIM PH 21723]
MRSRRILAALLAAGLTVTLTACGGGASRSAVILSGATVDTAATFEPDSTMARLKAAGKVTIGTKWDQPLFGQKGLDGKPGGFDVEVGKIVAAKLGLRADQIEWKEAPSKFREEIIERKDVDMVIATYTMNATRKKRITFSGPYYTAAQDLLVKRDNTTITGPDSLRPTKARVCSVAGSASAENVLKYIDAKQLVKFDVYSKCRDALRVGQVDAMTTDNAILAGYLSQSPTAFKLLGTPFTKEPYGIGISRGDVKFCEFIHQVMVDAAKNGTYQKAWTETAGKFNKAIPTLPEFDSCA